MSAFPTSLAEVPFMSRMLICGLVLSATLNYVLPPYADILLFQFAPIATSYQFWRIATAWLYEPSLLVMLLLLWNVFGCVIKYQWRNSTPVLLTDFMINGIFMTFLFALLAWAYYMYFGVTDFPSMGALVIWMNFFTKYCYNNPDNSAQLCSLFSVPLKVYPVAIYILCCLVCWEIRYDGLFGLLLAIPECLFFKSGLILFTQETYTDKQWLAEKIGLASLDCWEPARQERIIQNDKLTIESKQFYLNLHNFDRNQLKEMGYGEDSDRASHENVAMVTEEIPPNQE